MQISKTDAKDLMAKITLVVEPADYAEQVEKEIRTIRQKANVPGFRPGKVPASLVKKMYGKSVLAETINKVIGEKLYDYIREEKLNILGEPLSNEEETPEIDFDNQDTFTFVFDVALAPEFNAKLTASNKLNWYDVTITDEMVENQVKSYADRFGKYEHPTEAAVGDMLRGNLTEQKEDGKTINNQVLAIDKMKAAEQKKFIGAKEGDVITFNPKKAYDNEAELMSLLNLKKEEVADMKSDFAFELETITRHEPAAIDQELFDKVYGAGAVKSEQEFRDRVKAEMKASMDEDAKYKFGIDAKAAIMKKMEKVEFPEPFLKRWLKTANKELTDEQIEKDWAQTLDSLRWQLAKDQLAEQFEIKVEKADVDNYAKNIARMQFMQYGLTHVEDQYLEQFAADMLKDENQTRGIYERCIEDKVFDALKDVVKLEKKTISYEDFVKL